MAVDLALLIALDGSASVGFEEFNLIAGGLANGLRDTDVTMGLIGGPLRSSQLSLLLWSGVDAQAVAVNWTRVASEGEVKAFADTVGNIPRLVRAGETAIGSALAACEAALRGLPEPATRRLVNVAGDGRSNSGQAPGPVRDRLVATGVTINGLCVLHEEPDLVQSYTDEVIGGAGAFALACPDFAGFAEAMRRKLVKEIS